MGKLSASARKRVSSSNFAGPGRSFPVHDKEHARKALQLAPRALKKGSISKAQYERIVARARKKLRGKSRGD